MSVPDRDQRTLKPTPKRVDDFRKRGEIALSRDLSAVACMAGGAIVGLIFARASLAEIANLTTDSLIALESPSLAAIWAFISRGAMVLVAAAIPTVGGAVAGYFVSAGIQLGAPPALIWPKVDPMRPFSFQNLGQLFSPKAAAGRALKALAKLAFVGAALYFALQKEQELFGSSPALTAGALGHRMVTGAAHLATWAGAALFVLALVDYVYQKREIGARMRMTPEEMKREMKEMDGDPHVKRRRRQRMRELAKQRLVQNVKTADVVVVNPTEFAVALRYRSKDDKAPRVVAKGKKARAQRIRDVARGAGIPIIPQPPLARLLYKVVPEGKEIPGQVYQAVAEVLAYVYRLRNRRSR